MLDTDLFSVEFKSHCLFSISSGSKLLTTGNANVIVVT